MLEDNIIQIKKIFGSLKNYSYLCFKFKNYERKRYS